MSSRIRSSSRTESPAACASDWAAILSIELARQLRNIGQLRPRPLERRAELLEEVAHAVLAACDPVRQERAHLRPAEAGTEADRIVHLLDRRDVVVHEPERLTPERLEQAVGDESVDLLANEERLHSDRRVEVERAGDGALRRLLAGDDFDERQEVDGVERVPDHESLGLRACPPAGGSAAGPTSTSRRARPGARAASISARRPRLSASSSDTLSCTTSASPTASASEAANETDPTRARRQRQPRPGALGVLQRLAHALLGLRRGS